MRKLAALALTLCLSGLAGRARAAQYAGADPFDFLFLDAGARQAALGGAAAATGNDPECLAYNPAGLAFMESHAVSFIHTAHFQGVTRERLSLATRDGLGFSVDHIDYGAIQRTTLSNPAGTGLDSFTPTAMSLAVGYGADLGSGWGAGVAAKHVREDIDSHLAAAYAVDAGLQLRVRHPEMLVGLSVQNMGPKVQYLAKPEALPLNVKLGGAVYGRVLEVPFGLMTDVNKVPDGRIIVNAGAALEVRDGLGVRVGFNGRNDAGLGLTAGFGVELGSLTFDYAIVPFGALGYSHLFGFGLRWGR